MLIVDQTERGIAALMTWDPVVVDGDASIASAAEILDAYGISGAPVVDGDGELLGVVSSTDLVRLRGAGDPTSAWHHLRVADLMTRPAVTIPAKGSVGDAARMMTDRHVHRLVVVDDSGQAVGVISESDLVRDMAQGCELG